MKTVPCTVISRYGADDFSVWFVDIAEDEYKKLKENANTVFGESESLLHSLPIDGEMHFISYADDKAEISSCEADESFIEKYNHLGCSFRGPMHDIIYEIMTANQDIVTVTLTEDEANAIHSLIELELCNCGDTKYEIVLEAASAKMEKAMSRCIIPDCESESENEDDIEP